MKMCKAALAAAMLAMLVMGGSAAVAATSAPAGGKIQFFVTQVNNTKAKITVTGAIGDYGTSVSTDNNGKVNANGNFEKVTLKQGGFTVDATAFNKKLNELQPTINRATCSLVFSGSGPGTVGNGTGLYSGISGKLTITATFAGIAPRKNGKCNFAQNAQPLGSYQSITGTGNVSFS